MTTLYCHVVHSESGRILVDRARWCDSFACKLRGLTFRSRLDPGEGLVLVEKSDNRINSAITMLFTFVELGVFWVDDAGNVVDTIVARPWRPLYAPQAPARFAVETHPEVLEHVRVGDGVQFREAS